VLKKVFRVLFKSGLTVKSAAKHLATEIPLTPAVQEVLEFLKKSERGICS
jgi:UDP-N-acetylglucosamine acyltransferase